MQWTSLNDLREKYLSYFETKGHLRMQSASLIPANDPSLLLINSGMAPMKKYFTGEIAPPSKRVTTCQKCIRTPDIERVGKTARHGTYFEMLGNFSFGDYFKKEAIAFAWEFCTDVLALPVERLHISVYQDDDEAYGIWANEIGVDPSHIVRMGKEDNFWEHGIGPCGPCSEIYFDRGEKCGCHSPDCGVGCECDRYVEFWNLVFTQFYSDGKGNYTPLEHPNIDTGMGLERLACIMQDVDNIFEVDTMQSIMKHIGKIGDVAYKSDQEKDISLRVITDHIRSSTFMIGDGVMPSNEGRGYVLRRLIRRAARHGHLLGMRKPFLSEVCETVIYENREAYPELLEKKDFIKKLMLVEEESFSRTIEQGLQMLQNLVGHTVSRVLSGENAFRLYDTFGFPLDLIKDILAERNIQVDEEGFFKLMEEQRTRAREARKKAGADAWVSHGELFRDLPETEFLGYGNTESTAKVLAIVQDNALYDAAYAGDTAMLVLDRSVFYAESGGQVGDTGVIETETGTFLVQNTVRTDADVFLHIGRMKKGMLEKGDPVVSKVDKERREAIMRNHTTAHLLQAVLKEVLGGHVQQAGQLVDGHRMRFDFTHFSAVTPEELDKIEHKINRAILASMPVTAREMPIAEAKKLGATALFGEKYGDIVRVVSAGDLSAELCGGTHVDNTAKIGLCRIISESSVAAGVRRMEALTGFNVIEYMNSNRDMLQKAASVFKIGNMEELVNRSVQIVHELKEKDKEIEHLNDTIAGMKVDGLMGAATDVQGTKLVTAAFASTGADSLKSMCGRVKSFGPDIVVVLAGMQEDKNTVTFAAACGSGAVKKGAHAGNLVREVAQLTGGKGGGRPDMAMAGGKDLTKVDTAINAAEGILRKQMEKDS